MMTTYKVQVSEDGCEWDDLDTVGIGDEHIYFADFVGASDYAGHVSMFMTHVRIVKVLPDGREEECDDETE